MAYDNEYRINRRQRRKHGSIVPVLLLLATAISISLLVAGVWQMAEGEEKGSKSSSATQSSAVQEESSLEEPESSLPEISEPPEPQEEEPENLLSEGLISESSPVELGYFDDAVFVGDSITEGMLYYIDMGKARILAGTGVNFSTIYSAEVIKLEDGSKNTIMDELGKEAYGKVYVMLGGNEVRDVNKELFLKHYERVLDDIRDLQPQSLIYVQSMTPVTKNNNYNMDNGKIDEYNKAILSMCERKGLAYLDVASGMKDENGMLPVDASPKDGMHFGRPYFDKWYAYLQTHVAQEPQLRSQKESEERRAAQAKEESSQKEPSQSSSSLEDVSQSVSSSESISQSQEASTQGVAGE